MEGQPDAQVTIDRSPLRRKIKEFFVGKPPDYDELRRRMARDLGPLLEQAWGVKDKPKRKSRPVPSQHNGYTLMLDP